MNLTRTLILGIGNSLLTDEGAGIHALNLLQLYHPDQPDLTFIDGGKGQVSAAREVLDELGLHDLPMAGLAKEREELFTPGSSEPIVLPATSQALYLLQRLRDEAHRFAITGHRQRRQKQRRHSELDDIGGVGPKRRRELLTHFGGIAAIRGASREELAGLCHALRDVGRGAIEFAQSLALDRAELRKVGQGRSGPDARGGRRRWPRCQPGQQ